MCVEVSDPDPSNNWATTLEDAVSEHGCVDKLNVAAREVQFIWHVPPDALLLTSKEAYSQLPDWAKFRIIR